MTWTSESAAEAAVGEPPVRTSGRALLVGPWPLLTLLALAWAMRVALAWRGGQFYFPDEARYFRSRLLLRYFWYPDTFPSPYDDLLERPEHLGYVLFGMVGEALRFTGGMVLGLPDPSAARPESPFWLSAALLSLASVSCIALTWALARRVGAGEVESLLAAFLLACSGTLLHFSRHFVPYDSALALTLLAAWVGLKPRPSTAHSVLVGLLAALAFLTYNGYWLSAAVAIGLHLLAQPSSPRTVATRAMLSGFGGAIPLLAMTGLTALRGTTPLYESLRSFSGTVTQGEFAEGWTFTWEYLWHAEHALLLVWLAGTAFVVWAALRGSPIARRRGMLWLAGAAAIYLALAIGSAVLEEFVVYGRLARQLVPYLCLLAACAAHLILAAQRVHRAAVAGFVAALVLQLALHAAPSFAQRFPGDFEREVAAFAPRTRASSLAGCCWDFETDAFHRQGLAPDAGMAARYVLLNTTYLYPVADEDVSPSGREVTAAWHPIQHLPYQYESYTPAERAIFRTRDVRMRLVERAEGVASEAP